MLGFINRHTSNFKNINAFKTLFFSLKSKIASWFSCVVTELFFLQTYITENLKYELKLKVIKLEVN